MTVAACAGLVARGDPDRFASLRAAPPALRDRLAVLYAFNLEVARAPWVTEQTLIAEMRLQWWRDVVAAPHPRAHEVAGPLGALIAGAALPVPVLDRLIAARRWDVYRDPFDDGAAFDAYLQDTGAGLMWLAARCAGAGPADEAAVRDFGWAAALAAFLRAVPALQARGRQPLVGDVRDWAAEGLTRLARARRAGVARGVAPALLAGWQAAPLLRQVLRDPACVPEARLGLSEFSKRGRLVWAGLSGRW